MIQKIANKSSEILLFDEIEFENRVELIIGGNGVGKTTLLKAIEEGSDVIEITGDISKLHCWQNAKDNDRYQNPSPYGDGHVFNEKTIKRILSAEKSEGENVADSFVSWIENTIENGAIYLVDEVDSGLSLDNLNAIAHVINETSKEYDCQFILSVNAWHLIYVFNDCISLVDGSRVAFDGNYEEFCKFSFESAKKLHKVRSKQRK